LREQLSSARSTPKAATESETVKTLLSIQDILRDENGVLTDRYNTEVAKRKTMDQYIKQLNNNITMLKDEKLALQMSIEQTDVEYYKKKAEAMTSCYQELYLKVYGNRGGMREYAVCDTSNGKKAKPNSQKAVYVDSTAERFVEKRK